MKNNLKDTAASLGSYFRVTYKGLFYSYEDTARILFMVLAATILFWPDTTMFDIVRYVLGIQITLSLMSHLTRKLLFPYVQMSDLFDEVKKDPKAAAIAILSISIILSTLIYVSSRLFGGMGE